MDLVISFDTTGSMYPCLSEVRSRVKEFTDQMFSRVDGLSIKIVTHGDYCDGRNWLTEFPFEHDAKLVARHIRAARRTDGGDYPEAYEAVLANINSLLWHPNNKKVVIMIGDAYPHEDSYKNKGISWRDERRKLEDKGVAIYSVQCLSNHRSNYFWQALPTNNGVHLKLNQFGDVVDLLAGVMAHTGDNVDEWITQLKDKGKWNRRLRDLAAQFGHKSTDTFERRGLEPVPDWRFQVLTVDATGPIREFVERSGATFRTGRGFYLLTKPSLVQERKEVVLLDKKSGDMYTGSEAREMIGLPFGRRGKIYPRYLSDLAYDVFVQSTSYNRKLFEGTRFLYETEAHDV